MKTKTNHRLKKGRKIRKKHLVMSFLFLGMFLTIFFSCATDNAKASYSEQIIIDKRLESDYSFICETDNYSLYYANNNDYHYLFLNYTTSTLSGKTIKLVSQSYEEDISPVVKQIPDTLYSMHNATILELSVRRSVVGSQLGIIIEEDNMNIMVIPSPASSPVPMIVGEETDESEIDESQLGLGPGLKYTVEHMKWWQWLWIGFFSAAIPLICSFIIYRFWIYPIMRFRSGETGKFESYGRYVKEKIAKKLDEYFLIYLKSGIYYSRENYSDIYARRSGKMYQIERLFGDHFVIKRKLDKEDYFMDRKMKKDATYKFMKAIITIFPHRKLIKSVLKFLRKRSPKEEITEITEIVNTVLMEKTVLKCDIFTVERKKPKEKLPDDFEKQYLETSIKDLENLPISDDFHTYAKIGKHLDEPVHMIAKFRERETMLKVEMDNWYYDTERHRSYAEARLSGKQVDEYRNIFEKIQQRMANKMLELQNRINELKETIRVNNLNHRKEWQDAKIQTSKELLDIKPLDMLFQKVYSDVDGGMDHAIAFRDAAKEFHENRDEVLREYKDIISHKDDQIKNLEKKVREYEQILKTNGGKDKIKLIEYKRDDLNQK
ncbi:MAG: hypothetical protein ACFFCI_00930 [Promethearchaeota archaeon]